MLLKLVRKDETDILSGIDCVSVFYKEEDGENCKILSVDFKISEDKPKMNFVLSRETKKEYAIISEAYLMNDKGETIERLN